VFTDERQRAQEHLPRGEMPDDLELASTIVSVMKPFREGGAPPKSLKLEVARRVHVSPRKLMRLFKDHARRFPTSVAIWRASCDELGRGGARRPKPKTQALPTTKRGTVEL
jgi:transcriptional regulator GlxA family with amidase domain